MANKFKHVTVSPDDGGQLYTAISAESAGAANYVTKQDFRRELDQEVRREGYDYFVPNENEDGTSVTLTDTLAEIGSHPFPGGSGTTGNIELIHMIRRPNGQTAIIVAQKTSTDYKIYRYTGRDDLRYVLGRDDDNSGVIDSDEEYIQSSDAYFTTTPTIWTLIGSGYSLSGDRWQAVNINGYTIFNNGYDLPFAYRVEWSEVKPLYNLREAGVVKVGSISEYNGILMLADITELDGVEGWFLNPNLVLGASWDPYGEVKDYYTIRYHNRLIWSQINEPEKFGASVKGTIYSGTSEILLDYKEYGRSFSVGQEVTITGAGTAGGNLSSVIKEVETITSNNYTQYKLLIKDRAVTTVSSTDISPTSEIGSIIGYEDLEDDGSNIVNMLPLQNQIVIYKDTSIFIGEYTGDTSAPFRFRLVKIPVSRGLYYRNTLVALKGNAHAYIGRDNFYVFDLTMRSPKEMVPAQVVRDLFFDNADISQSKDVFATDNSMTNEVWFVFPSTATHKALCFDYIQNTMSTSTHEVKSAGIVKKPFTNQNMFLMGDANGVVTHYGKADVAEGRWKSGATALSSIYYRRSANAASITKLGYSSILKSGLIHFGDSYNEKLMRGYVIQLASQQAANANLDIKIYGYENPFDTADTLTGSSAFQLTDPSGRNLVPTHFKKHLFQDEITVPSTQTINVRIVNRTFDVKKIGSHSEVRQQAIV